MIGRGKIKTLRIMLIATGFKKMPKLLHVGCGPKTKLQTTREFKLDHWEETRLDIDVSAEPDVIGTMTDMSAIDNLTVDGIFSSHNIEHLFPHEVPVALAEFKRVLKDDGYCVITCPDLQSVCQLVAENKLTQEAYNSPAGPISPLDIIYGHRPSLQAGNHFMAHKCGFTENVLRGTLLEAGFEGVVSFRRGRSPFFDLWALASKQKMQDEELKALAVRHFPS